MIYRGMKENDYVAAYDLWAGTEGMGLSGADSRDEIVRFLDRNPGLSQICVTEEGELAGTALCGHDGRRGFLYHVAVSGKHRGKGIGKDMVTRCLQGLQAEGIAKCHIIVIEANAVGRRFWESTGWELRNGLVLYSSHTV
ncbi:GNAT family N-acetyltransferase [Paenibacillus sp. HN-1]|uniref:GNAT family N-acetyltransferase n=1 Tax=Paenibacillus TaxID=44249 RepID=UPI001CA7E2CF|nr:MULTISPECIES: GNAT family N-acetyltransferase [Paenibacillus]MBY9080013.1 GNAT family N-acetyltransferase [Paenibacillus sp. CGMCC 1.18879]MBY9086711.1 GNAT family N-acetyltransferase [Paenibacillus sinensis]